MGLPEKGGDIAIDTPALYCVLPFRPAAAFAVCKKTPAPSDQGHFCGGKPLDAAAIFIFLSNWSAPMGRTNLTIAI